ncbi:MAG: PQQ-binding-like beta-propeller repeat protein, partial [Planctomycetota bacterium]
MSSLLGLAAAALSSPLALAAQDWPHWRGPNFDDSTSGGGVFDKPFELRVRWRAEVGSGYAGIAVLGKTAVTLGARDGSDEVVALDVASGAVRWRQRLGPAFAGQDGAEDGPCATPTLHGDEVYAFAPRGELVALTLAEGKVRWKVDLVARHGAKMPHWGFTSAPLVSGELVIVAAGGEGATLVGLERATGATRWAVGNDAVHYPSPILARIGGEELVVFGGNSFLFGIDPASGAVRWRVAHGASEFFQQILQPLVLGEGDFLLENKRLSAARMVLAGSGPGAELETLWNSRHLSSNYNTTVAHDGLLFGHDGELLVCLDAESGELLWRSRPPGDGWVVGVDGWLVLLSKAGSLHCAPAVAEGYEERASLKLFERLCWTPPSFAHGAVFARDSSGAATCVEIAPARERPTPAAAARRAPPALFAALEREVAAADDPADVVDEFLAAQGSFPIVEGERTAHFVWRGEAQDVELVGDVLGDTEKHALERVPGTDLFWASFELEPDARVGYQFVKDLQQTLVDPRNERRSFS